MNTHVNTLAMTELQLVLFHLYPDPTASFQIILKL